MPVTVRHRWILGLLVLGLLPAFLAFRYRYADSGDLALPASFSLEESAWSPDGQHFAASGFGWGTEYLLLSTDDGKLSRVSPPEMDVKSFAWLPDSKSMLVAFEELVDDSDTDSAYTNLAVVDLHGNVTDRVEVQPRLRLWYGLSVTSDGTTAIAGGGPEGPAGFDFDGQLYRIDLRSGDATVIPTTTSGPIYMPQLIDDGTVIAHVDGPEGRGGRDDNHLVAVELADGATERVTPYADQVGSFSVRRCDATVFYISSGELRGYDDRPLFRLAVGEREDPVPLDVEGQDPAASPIGNSLYLRVGSTLRSVKVGPCRPRD